MTKTAPTQVSRYSIEGNCTYQMLILDIIILLRYLSYDFILLKEIPGVQCEGRPTEGPCLMKITGITFDPVSKTCKSYDDGGCGVTKNSFRDIEECEAKCSKFSK